MDNEVLHENPWSEYRRLVMSELEHLNDVDKDTNARIAKLDERQDDFNERLVKLETKIGIYTSAIGTVAGLLGSLGPYIWEAIKKLF